MAHPVSQKSPHGEHAEHGDHHAEHHGSFWPIILTVGATLLLLGALYPVLAIPGFLILMGSVIGWVREDAEELKNAPFATGRSPYLYGTLILIASELVIFGALFFFYFWSRSHADVWPAEQIAHLDMTVIILNTVLLLTSGATVHMAQHALEHGKIKAFKIWLGVTILLGLAFLGGQATEYTELIHEGMTAGSSAYATAFYSLTGVHGLHVAAGVFALTCIWVLSFKGFITKERLSGVTGAFLYWHFVDVVWIGVVCIVYLRLI